MESGEITTFNKVNLYLVIARGHYAASLLKLIEVAARDHLRRRAGSNAAERLDERLRAEHARQ